MCVGFGGHFKEKWWNTTDMKGLGTGLTVRRKEPVQGEALKLELHSLHSQSPSAADIPVLREWVQEIWGPHFHGQTSFLTSSWRMAFAKCIRENKFLSTINLCPCPNNFPSPMPAIQEKKKCQMQSFHQEAVQAGSALIDALLQNKLAQEKEARRKRAHAVWFLLWSTETVKTNLQGSKSGEWLSLGSAGLASCEESPSYIHPWKDEIKIHQ